jgi:antitoxin (DNA-binding transcriptional repressor) of toxin-antitoxin stability system
MIIPEYIAISKLRKATTNLCRPVAIGKKEYIVTSDGSPIFTIVKPLHKDNSDDQQIGVDAMRKSLSGFQDLLEEYGTVTLTAYGKPLVRCVKL